MKLLRGSLIVCLLSVIWASHAGAITTSPTPTPLATSPLLISAYGVSDTQTSLDFVQLYNDDDSVVALDGWRLAYQTSASADDVMLLDLQGYFLPHSHYILSDVGVVMGEGVREYSFPLLPGGMKATKIVLVPPTGTARSEQPVQTPDGVYKRNTTTTGYSSSTTFTRQTAAAVLAADPLYRLPSEPVVQIVEILPRSSDCTPNDSSLVCGDYIKLYNPTNTTLDLGDYRLRSDSSTSESSNAFALDYALAPHAYLSVYLRDDGNRLSLTDSGGYIWLEDAFGIVKFYDQTMVGYPSAGSDSKQGWAWALDESHVWQWTSTPQPNAPNVISSAVETSTELSECPAGKYRNPETNRCKNIEDAIATLIACDEDEYRSPETNRCRKLASTTSSTLVPCDEGEERNPATNRCRKLATDTALDSCPVGQVRNPDTNRCRKETIATNAATIEPPSEANIPLYILGGGCRGSARVRRVGMANRNWPLLPPNPVRV